MTALLSLLAPLIVSCTSSNPHADADHAYFSQPRPGLQPERLMLPVPPGRPDHVVRAVIFSAGGDEAYWPVIDPQDDYKRWIEFSVLENGAWTPPRIAPFSDRAFYDDVPFLAPSGDQMFFMSARPLAPGGPVDKERIWRLTRTGDGWSDPVALPAAVNEPYTLHQQMSVDRAHDLYFGGEGDGGLGSLDIYRAAYIDGAYQAPENLGAAINTAEGDYAPSVAPDGSYLIFTRILDDGGSLFVSFRTPEGAWTPATDLRPFLPGFEGANLSNSFLTADGKSLVFFDEREEGTVPFWIDESVIEGMR